jgi:hypothetical protein
MNTANGTPSDSPPEFGHPRGTLALVILLGLFFAVGWLVMYFGAFVERGVPHAH